MVIEIKVPSVGESVTEALLAQWFKNDGDLVKKDEPLFVIETDKVTLEVVAEADGVLTITVAEGETVAIGAVVGTLDTQGVERSEATAATPAESAAATEAAPPAEPTQPPPPEPAAAAPPPGTAPPLPVPEPSPDSHEIPRPALGEMPLAPAVRRLVAERNLDPARISGTGPGGRITKGDVVLYLENTVSTL